MKKTLFVLWIISSSLFAQDTKLDPLQIAKRIADRVIRETSFEFTEIEQKPSFDLQVIDFPKAFNDRNTANVYAFAKIIATEKINLMFGISYSEPFKIWINNQLVFQNSRHTKFRFNEIAYEMFTYQDTFSVSLNKGENRIIVYSPKTKNSIIYLREITAAEKKPIAKFEPIHQEKKFTWSWCYLVKSKMGSSKIINNYPSKLLLDSLYDEKTFKNYDCIIPKPALLKKLAINPLNTFKKDSYADWNYPNGILMMTVATLSDATDDLRYKEFVNEYCNFIIDNLTQFKKQYYKDHDLRGSFYRIFRKCMLDDAGSPSLPFAELELIDKTKRYDALLNEMVNYVYKEQPRLSDGTLCRPEPEKWTVWADDLFMSVPLFVRAARINHNKKYLDDAAKQVINFNKYLFDAEKGLYKHGWFSQSNEKSKIFWGRANGWVIWATSELIQNLPKNHPLFKQVEKIFTNHLRGLIKFQDESGMWHQILDDKSSFEETSCTSMFIIGFSRAIINGMIDKKYSANVMKAWNALQNNFSQDGIVKDICCGTGIGYTSEFYKTRDRYNNDPRGLGAVITSAIEVDRLEKYLRTNK
ncbi:MAG: glycoside hydrolase family 88 protein [Ignavibacteriales bacterium]|nr:glycoside hydrolase family 88 protein [Ignavibacteriales bacterium]